MTLEEVKFVVSTIELIVSFGFIVAMWRAGNGSWKPDTQTVAMIACFGAAMAV